MATPDTPLGLKVNNALDITNSRRSPDNILTWDANVESDIASYNIYRSYVPYGNFVKITEVTHPTITYTDQTTLSSSPSVPGDSTGITQTIDGQWYYRISAVSSLSEESELSEAVSYEETEAFDSNIFTSSYTVGTMSFDFSPDDYCDLPDNEDLKDYFDRIRAQGLWMLMNNGQDVWLYKRRKEGTKCPLWEDDAEQCSHPLGINNNLENACYGTGILGGYYDPVKIRIRLVSSLSKVSIEREGMRIINTPRSWTIWAPRVSNFDFIITSDGNRYEITNVNSHRSRGGLITHQDFDVIRKWETDLIYHVPATPLRT